MTVSGCPADRAAAAARAGPGPRPPPGMRMNSHKYRSVHAAAFIGPSALNGGDRGPDKAGFRPYPAGSGNATLSAAICVVDRAAHGRDPGRKNRARRRGRNRTMKHIMGTALRVAGCVVLLGAGVALVAGKDDIRKFNRMRSM